MIDFLADRRTAAAVAALFVVFASAAAPAWAQGRAARVGVDSVRSEPVSQTVPVLGRLVPRRAGIVAARVAGPLAEMRVEIGDRVEQGDVLAVLVRDRLRAQRDLARADLAAAKADVETQDLQAKLAKQELDRLVRLRQNKSAAFRQALYDDKKMEYTMRSSASVAARAGLQRAEANLRLISIDLRNSEVKAPYGGVVTLRHQEAGAYLRVGDALVTLVGIEELEIEADVPSERISGLSNGVTVPVQVGEAEAQAIVRAVVPSENPLTRTRAVRFVPSFDTREEGYAAEQSVTVRVPVGAPRRALTVHKDAVLNKRGNAMVFLVDDGKAKPRPVTLGEAFGGRFEVLTGLAEGDVVVVRGNERLRPGQAVRSATEQGKKAPGKAGTAPRPLSKDKPKADAEAQTGSGRS